MAATMRVEHVAATPRGYRVKSVKRGGHVARIAVPPGRRRKGAGVLIELLHPKKEKNPRCEFAAEAKRNPTELLIFGNPGKREAQRTARERAARIRSARLNANHKPNCKCFACKHQRAVKKTNPGKMTVTFDRGIGKYSAALRYEGRNLYGTGYTKKQAAQALREEWRRARKAGNPRRRRADRNPDETRKAVQLFEVFHGRDAQQIVEKQVSATIRMDYTSLGKLQAIGVVECHLSAAALVNNWEKCPHLAFIGDGVNLASSPNRKQLYCIGGNQDLRNCLTKFEGIDPTKDFIDLGDATFVVYEARKAQSNFDLTDFVHKFGEKGGVLPRLMWDRLKKQVFFVGGEYTIDAPGIEN